MDSHAQQPRWARYDDFFTIITTTYVIAKEPKASAAIHPTGRVILNKPKASAAIQLSNGQ